MRPLTSYLANLCLSNKKLTAIVVLTGLAAIYYYQRQKLAIKTQKTTHTATAPTNDDKDEFILVDKLDTQTPLASSPSTVLFASIVNGQLPETTSANFCHISSSKEELEQLAPQPPLTPH